MDTTIARPMAARLRTPLLLLLLIVIGLTACGPGATTGSAVTSVTVTPSTLQLGVGATSSLEATVQTVGGAGRAVTWTSDDDTIAEVDDDGTVTGVSAGSTTITATSDHDPSKSASAAVIVTSSGPAPVAWTVQFGDVDLDSGAAVAVDSAGYVVVVGTTTGDLEGTNAGDYDAFVRRLTPAGEEVWTRQFGTAGWDEAFAVAIDADDRILVAGMTGGALAGSHQGSADVFVRRYSPEGDEDWTEQFGGASFDRATSIAIDGNGDIVVAGQGVGVLGGDHVGPVGFVRKFSPTSGGVTEDWTYVAPTIVEGLAIDAAGHVVAAGELFVSGFGFETYVVKLSPAGALQWTELYGTGAEPEFEGDERDEVPPTRRPTELWENLVGFGDFGYAVAVDGDGNVFVAGTMGGFETGTGHAYQKASVLKLTPAGVEEWAVLFGDEYATFLNGIAVDANGYVVATGNTASYYSDRSPAGTEMFTRYLTPDGTLLWDDTFGDSGWDTSRGVAIDPQGNVYNVGYTLGDLGGPNEGVRDVFVRKYAP